MLLSYAQNLEDHYLDLLFHDLATGTYIDVGGGHPVADNVSFHAYLKGWRGLVVEPQADLARLYAGVRPRDHVVSCLAGRTSGTVDFHVVAGMHGLSSTVAANAEQARGLGATTTTVRKAVEPLSGLIDKAGLGAVQFLKIDVEGAEPDVIAGLDFARHRPWVILVEAVNPNNLSADVSAWEPMLLAAGYSFAFFDNLNRYYVAPAHQHLAARLPAAPIPWDSIGHLWNLGRVAERTDHPDRPLADALAAGLFAELPRLAADEPALVAALLRRGAAALQKGEPALETFSSLVGNADGLPRPHADTVEKLLASDAFRAALGRIASMYDGGHIV